MSTDLRTWFREEYYDAEILVAGQTATKQTIMPERSRCCLTQNAAADGTITSISCVAGSTLIQPAETLHAPLSLINILKIGNYTLA